MTKFEPDEDLVRKLSSLLSETGLTEIEYEANGQRIRVVRGGVERAHSLVVEAPPVAAAASDGRGDGGDHVPKNAVLSPMVGTVYLAPEPGAAAFAGVGDQVKEGQTLMIIEAMKVMNPIPSPRTGKVTRVLTQDGQPVEFGEPLLVIE